MTFLRTFLIASILLIFSVSIYVIATMGINWPAIYFADMRNLDWRAQFDTDLLILLCLLAIWITWREGFTFKGFLFGFLSFFIGVMFSGPYLLFATYRAKGELKMLLMGVHSDSL